MKNKRYLLLDCLITDIEVEMDPCCVFVVNNTNLNDSTSSSDAADVLIHSTRAALGASREEIQHESHNKVNIYIRRLSDSEDVHSVNEREIPPVHRVNFPSALDTGNTIRLIIVRVWHKLNDQKNKLFFTWIQLNPMNNISVDHQINLLTFLTKLVFFSLLQLYLVCL